MISNGARELIGMESSTAPLFPVTGSSARAATLELTVPIASLRVGSACCGSHAQRLALTLSGTGGCCPAR